MKTKKTNAVAKSIQDKHVEIHYNEKHININGESIHIDMQGKINCPVLNNRISSLVCSKLMDQLGWPRNCDSEICKKANCKINESIRKNVANRQDRKTPIKAV